MISCLDLQIRRLASGKSAGFVIRKLSKFHAMRGISVLSQRARVVGTSQGRVSGILVIVLFSADSAAPSKQIVFAGLKQFFIYFA
jgi:hypothetical protein